ncbi:MAG TPA: drug/metabolite exporter YedA [Polyangiales bacterium]|nr:drug/metabolite exporter YedA [Polyangiales bacterium]
MALAGTETGSASSPPVNTALVVAALLAVYFIWGSTYFAMRIAMDALPPFLMCGVRFVVAGAGLLVFLRWRGMPLPTLAQWGSSAIVGTLLLVCGNGLVAVAERTVDSGVAATVVATMPLWMAAIGAAIGERITIREWLGLAIGFAGVAVLNRAGTLALGSIDTLAILVAPIAWAVGSVWSRRLSLTPKLMGTAAQMLCGGVILLLLAAVTGERMSEAPSIKALAALAYLIVFGSLIAFSAYGFLLRNTRSTIASSYAYVNAVVALAIGRLLGSEPFTAYKLVACALTVVGVAIAMRPHKPAPLPAPSTGVGSLPSRSS